MKLAKLQSASLVSRVRRAFRRGPWENVATAFIAIGVVMLCQPFLMILYSYSFVTILTGVALFTIVTKLPK